MVDFGVVTFINGNVRNYLALSFLTMVSFGTGVHTGSIPVGGYLWMIGCEIELRGILDTS